ncbi:hypothetical protein EDC96DRAFT_495631 [Choanephora cucurbitarum]|uniref:Uncharacterized protein n=1 Tax=Choanephora cucurbitarum TaxID=101091 RepID=A0A1C7NR41_9FUNG|nr:hypothetical protein EDC96DRAFT_495631 [Choanephora cucurbitarum]OBZ91581.1 hypothetical protein A0J61_00390 [Choanephora cucurbitarum]
MVSVSGLLFSGLALIAAVNAVPSPEVQSLQKMNHYNKMVESNFEIQPRGCTDTCCSGPASCCSVNGCIWRDGRCNC